MPKCNRVGCKNEATHHNRIPISYGMVADEHLCEEHYLKLHGGLDGIATD